MNLTDDIRARQDQQIVVSLYIAMMVPEPLTSEVRLRQRVSLDHRSHCAIEEKDSPGEQFVQALDRRHAASAFRPLAIRTANGSPALLAPTCTRTSARPPSRRSVSS